MQNAKTSRYRLLSQISDIALHDSFSQANSRGHDTENHDRIYANGVDSDQRRRMRRSITYLFNNFKDLFKKNDSNSDIRYRVNETERP